MARGRISPSERIARRRFWLRVTERLKDLEQPMAWLSGKLGKGVRNSALYEARDQLNYPLGSELLKLPEILHCHPEWLFYGRGAKNGR